MQSAYVEYKDDKNLLRTFSLNFGKQSANVYIWKSVRGLRRNTYFKFGDYVGAYVAYPYRKARKGLFGEIHLVSHKIGAGYVAHEIQHLLFDWFLTQRLNDALNERMALLAGNITKEFWNKYYE